MKLGWDSRQSRVLLPATVAVCLGTALCWQAYHWIFPARSGIGEPRYLVYRRNLEAGHPLQLADLGMLSARAEASPPISAVTDQDLVALKGSVLLSDVKAGALVTFSALELRGDGIRLGRKVPLGMRAYPIRFQDGVPIQPSDFVDILLVPDAPGESPIVLAEGVGVLSVESGASGSEALVALAPEELELVEKALQRGKLKLALRNPDETRAGRASHRTQQSKTHRKTKRIEIWSEENG